MLLPLTCRQKAPANPSSSASEAAADGVRLREVVILLPNGEARAAWSRWNVCIDEAATAAGEALLATTGIGGELWCPTSEFAMKPVLPPRSPLTGLSTVGPMLIASGALAVFLTIIGPRSGLPLRPHAPDWELLAAQTPVLQTHIAAAVVALAIGGILLAGVKGNRLHRVLGWTWAVAMGLVALTSIFIRDINGGAFSFIHLFTGWVIIILPMALYAARRHEIARHRSRMTGLFVGALLIAGMFTFFPGRLLWRVFLG